MTVDLFLYTETNRRPWAEQVARGAASHRLEVEDGADLPAIIAAAMAAGVPQGTQRSGVFEVQTPQGIFAHHNLAFRERGYGKLDPAKAHFTPWED